MQCLPIGKIAGMKQLLSYLNGLPRPERLEFARRCGTSEGYLRKAVSKAQRLDGGLCINIDRESGGAVPCECLRSDIDWGYLRRSHTRPSVATQDASHG